MKCSAVLFDLDGTLIDSAPDYFGALNELLVEQNRDPIPFVAGHTPILLSAWSLLEFGFDRTIDRTADKPLRTRLLDLYKARMTRQTKLFAGVSEVLDALDTASTPWAIVTNKPGFLTDPLIEALGLRSRTASVVSGDTFAVAKPHPEPILHTCRTLGVAPESTVMIGDSEVDIAAGRAAGTKTIATLYGYIPDNEEPASWNADVYVERAADLLPHL
ncbi:MAG: HAD family hydrolase [Planctomycetaceae bacterium]